MSPAARRVLLLLWVAVALLVLARLIRRRFLAVEVAGLSMTPTLESEDCVLVMRRKLPPATAGAIVYLHGPGGRPMLKRVVGLPGDSLRVGAHVEVNGRRLLEPYAHGAPPPHQYRGVHRLSEDEFFVLGDHRARSTDSRDFGPVRGADIKGVAIARYWPPERIGRVRRPPRMLLTEPLAPDFASR